MKFIALEIPIPGVRLDTFTDDLLEQEASEIWRLYQSSVVREVYYRGDRKAKVIVLECDDLAAAQNVIRSLPLVRHGLIDFDVTALLPYRGFQRIFSS